MKRFLCGAVVTAAVVLAAGCASRDVAKPETQDNVGVRMATMNLWREAMFRFRRAVEINPNDAMAHNNLAVAYEANGDFDSARKEYLEALKLDRGNAYIQKNYSRYVEFLSRNKKRAAAPKTAGAAPGAPVGTQSSSSSGTLTPGPPDKPEATGVPKPVTPPTAVPPTDMPPQPQPKPPPTPPPGGAR